MIKIFPNNDSLFIVGFLNRSLGPEFGGAIGIVFSFANAVAAAMYVIGFCETLVKLLESYGVLAALNLSEINLVRLFGLGVNTLLILIALIGMGWESKVQIFLLAILLLSFVNFLVGSFIPPSDEQRVKGFLGYRCSQPILSLFYSFLLYIHSYVF